jgi:outer membrane protein OmpA-like peptidoglycan-associated protein
MSKILHVALGGITVLAMSGLVSTWTLAAGHRLQNPTAEETSAPIAAASDVGYCSVDLKKILRRVLQSCGLLSSGEVRGCQPLEAKNVATMSGDDFNALFDPLKDRAGIIQFDLDQAELDANAQDLLDRLFADQRGASYFFVVARASPEGQPVHNRDLSQRRGQAILTHLREHFNDPDLDREVGLLWLGEEYAQLNKDYCSWQRSGSDSECSAKELNRSAFVAWIDCRI